MQPCDMLNGIFVCGTSNYDCPTGNRTFKVTGGNAFVLRPGQVASSPGDPVTVEPGTVISGRFSKGQMVAGVIGTGVPLLLLLLSAALVILKQRRSYRQAIRSSHERARESWRYNGRGDRDVPGNRAFEVGQRTNAVELFSPNENEYEVPGDALHAHELDARHRNSLAVKDSYH